MRPATYVYIKICLILNHILISNNLLTSSVCISHLPADHSSISAVPEMVTNCPPLVVDAHLHSTLIRIGASHQTNITISTVATGSNCREVLNIWELHANKW